MAALGGYARYAVYWAPERGSWLEAFGASWFGWDAEAGERRMRPRVDLPVALEDLTDKPARYSFHATLRPPFALAEGTTAAGLDGALSAFAAERAPVAGPGLAPGAALGFVALTPLGPAPEIDALAFALVRALDPFRAPPDAQETARRAALSLSRGQQAMLADWGYPYVGPEFRFHVTLTRAVDPATAAEVIETVAPLVVPHLEEPFRIGEICLFGDPGGGSPFRLLKRYPLVG